VLAAEALDFQQIFDVEASTGPRPTWSLRRRIVLWQDGRGALRVWTGSAHTSSGSPPGKPATPRFDNRPVAHTAPRFYWVTHPPRNSAIITC